MWGSGQVVYCKTWHVEDGAQPFLCLPWGMRYLCGQYEFSSHKLKQVLNKQLSASRSPSLVLHLFYIFLFILVPVLTDNVSMYIHNFISFIFFFLYSVQLRRSVQPQWGIWQSSRLFHRSTSSQTQGIVYFIITAALQVRFKVQIQDSLIICHSLKGIKMFKYIYTHTHTDLHTFLYNISHSHLHTQTFHWLV